MNLSIIILNFFAFVLLTFLTSCGVPDMYGQSGSLKYLPKVELNYQGLDLQKFQDSLIFHADSCGFLVIAKEEVAKMRDVRKLIYFDTDPKGYVIIQDATMSKQLEFYIHLRVEQDKDGYSVHTDEFDSKQLKDLQKRLNLLLTK